MALAHPSLHAAEESTTAKNADHALLEDLGANLLEDDDAPDDRTGASGARDAQLVEPRTPTRDEPAGDDRAKGQGTSAGDLSLRQVARRMRRAESALASGNGSGQASAAQQAAIRGLDAMIASLQKQCEQAGAQSNLPASPGDKLTPSSGKRGGSPGASDVRLANADKSPVDRAAIDRLAKELWGRLPDRQREELLQPLSEEFLPEYAAEIEDYFRDLAAPAAATEARP